MAARASAGRVRVELATLKFVEPRTRNAGPSRIELRIFVGGDTKRALGLAAEVDWRRHEGEWVVASVRQAGA